MYMHMEIVNNSRMYGTTFERTLTEGPLTTFSGRFWLTRTCSGSLETAVGREEMWTENSCHRDFFGNE